MRTARLLSAADLVLLYDCFLEAFSDYQVDMRMSQQQFEQRLNRDGVQLEVSVGAFDDDRMIGFYLNGLGTWQGRRTAYDAGTGVIQSYRGRGVAQELFAFMVPPLKEAAVSQYLLEVLSTNERAVSLYRKLGFVEVRNLAVLRSNDVMKPRTDLDGISVRQIERPDWALFESFWDGYPSWQNSTQAVERVADERLILAAYKDEQCVGYGVVFRPAGILMQLAVARAYRRKGIGRRILAALSRNESLKVNNVDEQLKGTLAFFEASGFERILEQYEMVKTL